MNQPAKMYQILKAISMSLQYQRNNLFMNRLIRHSSPWNISHKNKNITEEVEV